MAGRIGIIIALVALASGCANAFLNGARMAANDTPVTGALAAWNIGTCSNGETTQLSYFLLQGEQGQELFERPAQGRGSIVTNTWTDAQGTHFYQWVGRRGWDVIITAPGQPAIRNIYLSTGSPDGRPDGQIDVTCPLTPAATQ